MHHLDLIFLSETLISDANTASIVNRLGFFDFVHVPPPKKWGGLLCMWRLGLDVEPVHVGCNIIAILVYFDPTYVPCS